MVEGTHELNPTILFSSYYQTMQTYTSNIVGTIPKTPSQLDQQLALHGAGH